MSELPLVWPEKPASQRIKLSRLWEFRWPRADDDEENFRSRHAEFTELTIPVIKHYRSARKLVAIPASAPKDEVAATILSSVKFKI